MDGTILVVEDSSDLRSIYEMFLRAEGYRVITATNGVEAMDLLHGELPDLILLDIGLPLISGWDLLQMIRRHDEWHDIPVVIISALGDPVSLTNGWSMGCTSYLRKPCMLKDLGLLVRRLVPGLAPQAVGAAG